MCILVSYTSLSISAWLRRLGVVRCLDYVFLSLSLSLTHTHTLGESLVISWELQTRADGGKEGAFN